MNVVYILLPSHDSYIAYGGFFVSLKKAERVKTELQKSEGKVFTVVRLNSMECDECENYLQLGYRNCQKCSREVK